MRPKFSIAIPAYNRADYLSRAIGSALAQTAPNFELIVSDDASTDDLGLVVASFNDSRIKYYRSPSRLGAARNHQRSVDASQGEYIVNLHSDDLLLPTYLESAGAALDCCGEAAAVYSSMVYLSGATITGCQSVPKIGFADKDVLLMNPWLEKFHNVAPTCCMFRRSALLKVGGYRLSLRFAYDWDLFMRFMTIGGGVIFSREVLSIYRQHEEQASQTSAHQGLYDILDLWQLEEYSHWPPAVIADLVLAVLRLRMQFHAWVDVFNQISSRGVALKVLSAMPGALARRLNRTEKSNTAKHDEHYEAPTQLEKAIVAATALVERVSKTPPKRNPEAGEIEEGAVSAE